MTILTHALAFLAGALLVNLIWLHAFQKLPGCTGDCQQGRAPCNCR